MAEKALVSVVIPTYKRPTALKRAIESVLSQTYKNTEIFVVDDNDPDTDFRRDTETVMSEYADCLNITYLKHEKNRGGSAARNTGWQNATGKYITFLDDDDEISPNKLLKQVECLEKADGSYGACYTAYKRVQNGRDSQISAENREGWLYIPALMRTLYMGSGSNLLLKKSVVDEIGGYDESFVRNQDIEFLARVLENYKLAFVDEILLVIHQDAARFNRSFEEFDGYSKYYLERFADRIGRLPKKDQKRIYSVVSLERSRVAVNFKEYRAAFKILHENRVSIVSVIKYVIYLAKRVITHSSYGFNLK
ncbi:MAG: glycosyltransferase family 2 protein [Clostridia bacterium]|nr:glycosyltransferase family 2 protein [Clostridia bacterium]